MGIFGKWICKISAFSFFLLCKEVPIFTEVISLMVIKYSLIWFIYLGKDTGLQRELSNTQHLVMQKCTRCRSGNRAKQKEKKKTVNLTFRSSYLLWKGAHLNPPNYQHLSRQHSRMKFSNFLKHSQFKKKKKISFQVKWRLHLNSIQERSWTELW